MKLFIAVIIVLLYQGCNIFEKDQRLLAEHQKSDGERIKIYFVGVGATTKDVIQVRNSSRSSPIWISENYNYIESSKLINDTILQLILSDTGYHNHNNSLDTVFVNVK